MVLGDLDLAQTQMCEAVLLNPESLALEGLASLYLSKRAPRKAQKWMEQALKVRPDRSKTLEVAGDVYSQLGKVDEAKKAFAGAIKVDPSDQKTLDQVALQFIDEADRQLRSGAIDQAELFYRRAATLSPTSAQAAAGMAASHAAAGATEGAQLWAERTLPSMMAIRWRSSFKPHSRRREETPIAPSSCAVGPSNEILLTRPLISSSRNSTNSKPPSRYSGSRPRLRGAAHRSPSWA
jgi:tetratricopeptide (TPR) repeat protein